MSRKSTIAYWLAIFMTLPSAGSAAPDSIGEVKQALAKIPSVQSGNVLARMQACGIRIRSESSVETVPADVPDRGYAKGDVEIAVVFDLPKPPPGYSDSDRQVFTDLGAVWVKRGPTYVPRTGWAKNLQQERAPILGWLRC